MEHEFTNRIRAVLQKHFGEVADDIFKQSPLLQYLNIKTRSATRGSKARGSFANIYALYVLVEDYMTHGFHKAPGYSRYEGARFSDLFQRQRKLPFGAKLQNHALNHRLNEEFRKYFSQESHTPIIRDVDTNRYWLNEHLITVRVGKKEYNLAVAIGEIIDEYIEAKRQAFDRFIAACQKLRSLPQRDKKAVEEFILSLLALNMDARIFEIVSYAILKSFYHDQRVYFGFDLDTIKPENLTLYKTGRTNANDGGIDFVMRPLGRFFQVTETLDLKKYFLDIDKIERYPITFVIKSDEPVAELKTRLREAAEQQYAVAAVVAKYMECIEEIVNIPILKERFTHAITQGYLQEILDEIIRQSKVEFNYENNEEEEI
jgi:hypothetical protein